MYKFLVYFDDDGYTGKAELVFNTPMTVQDVRYWWTRQYSAAMVITEIREMQDANL